MSSVRRQDVTVICGMSFSTHWKHEMTIQTEPRIYEGQHCDLVNKVAIWCQHPIGKPILIPAALLPILPQQQRIEQVLRPCTLVGD